MDFFAGSGSLQHAVWLKNLEDGGNRKCISIQLPEQRDADGITVSDIAKERIRRAGVKIKEEHPEIDIGFKVLKLIDSGFI